MCVYICNCVIWGGNDCPKSYRLYDRNLRNRHEKLPFSLLVRAVQETPKTMYDVAFLLGYLQKLRVIFVAKDSMFLCKLWKETHRAQFALALLPMLTGWRGPLRSKNNISLPKRLEERKIYGYIVQNPGPDNSQLPGPNGGICSYGAYVKRVTFLQSWLNDQ